MTKNQKKIITRLFRSSRKWGVTVTTLILAAIIMLPISVSATSNAVAYLENGVGARSKAMANAQVAIVNDGYAGYWNPAGLGRLTKSELNAMSTKIWGVIDHKFYGFASPLIANSGVSLCYIEAGVDDIWETSSNGADTGNRFSYKGSTVLASLGCGLDFFGGIMRGQYIGITAKFIQESLHSNTAKGKELDIGWMYRIIDKGWAGIQVQNVLPEKIIWDTAAGTEEEVPMVITMGLGYQMFDNLNIAVDLRLKEKRKVVQHFGAEWAIINYDDFKTTLRGGFKGSKAAIGLGLYFNNFNLDYAYDFEPNDYISTSHWISVGYRFSMLGDDVEE